jgi:hypothetical protein
MIKRRYSNVYETPLFSHPPPTLPNYEGKVFNPILLHFRP